MHHPRRASRVAVAPSLTLAGVALLAAMAVFPGATGCAGTEEPLGQSGPTATAATTSSSTATSTGNAAGSTSGSTGSGSTSGASMSNASSGDVTSGAGGAGGEGGASSTSTGEGGGGGSPAQGTVLLLAGGGATVIAGEFHPGGAWTVTSLAGTTTHAPALTILDDGTGVGLIRSTGGAGELRFTTWSSGAWTPFTGVAALVTTRESPALATDGLAAHAVFHGDDFKHYYARYQASWSPVAEAVGGVPQQSFGPAPSAIAVAGGDPVLAYPGSNGDLFDQTRTAGVWGAGVGHQLGNITQRTPAIVELGAGPELMVVLVRESDAKLLWTTRTAGVWTAPVEITGALGIDRPALAALPGGAAVVAFRGTDAKLYTSRFDGASWSAPAVLGGPNATIASAPALAPGVGTAEAELAFADVSTGAAYHARLVNGAWTAPALAGGVNVTTVAIASLP